MSVFRNIRERRLVQILVAYLAAGWVGIEVVGSLVEHEVLPRLAYTLALLWYVTGVPVATLVGWYHGEKGNQTAPKWEMAVILVVILSLGGFSATQVGGYLAEQREMASAAQGRFDPRRVAVDYFTDGTSDGSLRHVADGVTEELIHALAGVRALDVISINGMLPFRGIDIPADSLAEALEAGTVVRGTVHPAGDGVQVDVRLIDGASGAEYRRASVGVKGEQMADGTARVAEEVARFLRQRLGEEVAVRESRARASGVNAWALFHQARKLRKDASHGLHHAADANPLPVLEEADSLLAVAHRLDPTWVAPVRERADLAYLRSRLSRDPHARLGWAKRAVELGTEALGLEDDDPGTLTIRGTARYWRWLIDPGLDDHDSRELFQAAKADLERAVKRDPSQASAYSTLSHLYYNDDGGPSAVALAAQRAYEEDAYLDVASDVLWRLHLATMDMGDFPRSKGACEEGHRRFPEDARFTHCRLRLMATPAIDPDVEAAWAWAAEADSLAPEPRRAYDQVNNRLFVAGVLVRAGLADSARAVLDRAHDAMPGVHDPGGDLLTVEAAIRCRLGDHGRAVELLEQYLARNPGHMFDPAAGLAWWWTPMEEDPRFRRLVTLRERSD